MKIALLSDLHLSVHPLDAPHTDADVVVLAGDLHRPAQAMAWARQFAQPTLFVAGNHEFYGSDLVTTLAQLRQHAAASQVRVLERSEWQHGGVRFLGCTLWSDYRLFSSPAQREEGLRKALEFVGSPLNACFVSDLQAHILRWQPRLWLHGHVHQRCDYQVGATRVVANPHGYAPGGVAENTAFAPALVLEI